jgi:hypothetical protein
MPIFGSWVEEPMVLLVRLIMLEITGMGTEEQEDTAANVFMNKFPYNQILHIQ